MSPQSFCLCIIILVILISRYTFISSYSVKYKELAGPAALSAVLAGITEPAIYGVTLRFKRPFFIGAVFSGIAGAIVAAAGTGAPTLLGTSILTLPGYIGVGFVGFFGK